MQQFADNVMKFGNVVWIKIGDDRGSGGMIESFLSSGQVINQILLCY